MNIERIKLNLIPTGSMPVLHASQYDEGRLFRAEIYEGVKPYIFDGTELISLVVRKPDSNLVTMDIANVYSGKRYIDFVSTEQMCAVAGQSYGEITLEKNGVRIGSLNFYLQVEGAPDEGDITSQSEINNLKRQITDEVDRILPNMVENIAPAIVEEVAPDVVREVAPAVIEDVAPPILERLAPSAVAEVAPAVVAELVPLAVAEVAPSVVREVAPAIVEELVPIAVGDNYYNKTQTKALLDTKANASDVEYRKNTYTKTNPTNAWTSGYYWGKTAYENSSYAYSSFLDISAGDIVTISENAQFRFVEVYNSNGDIIDSVSSFVTTYTVPNGAVSMVLTVSSSNLARKYPIIDKFSIVTCFKRNKGYSNFYLVFPSVSSGDLMTLVDHIDNKKNCEYFFTGKFSSFTSLEIGHGKTSGIYCVIDNTNITVYGGNSQVQQFAHGLTLTDFITVSIKCGDIANARGSVTIQTNGGYYRKDDNFIFTGCKDTIYFIPLQSMTDCEFAYTIMDSRKDIFVFGDSYISLADSKKWVKYAIEDNDNNMLLCGYSGAKSTDEIIPFRKLNEQRNPLFVCWLLGMNDADNGTINADWKACVDEVIEYCNSHDIVPILATIPNTPNIDHTYKNAYVKESGCRYIDFAKAVNAESAGSSWYSGMLGSDNVHPTEEGAKALWLRAILDCPELIL